MKIAWSKSAEFVLVRLALLAATGRVAWANLFARGREFEHGQAGACPCHPKTWLAQGTSSLLIAIALVAATGCSATPPPRPNVVFILADDLGWKDTGCYGHPLHETPNIDRLSSQGMLFTNAYANAPNCAPTRASLISGQYTPRHGVYTVGTSERGRAANRKLIPTPNTTVLADSVVTLPEVLSAAGYATASVGKWHLGDDPTTQGFDLNIGGNRAGRPRSYFSPYQNPDLPDGPEGEYLTDRLTEGAIDFIRSHRDEPFFLYLTHFAVHTPIQGKADLVTKYQKKQSGLSRRHARYAAMVDSLDQSVGRVLDVLDELDLADNTVVVFFSDNGGLANVTSMAPLRGSKGMLYEGGIRVPLIVRWPGIVPASSRCEVPVIGTDMYPTILEMTGIKKPSSKLLDGKSLMPLLTRTGDVDREAIFWHFPAYLEGSRGTWRTTPGGAVRAGKYKLIEFFEDSNLELYNLEDDIGESVNLIDREPERASEMHRMLLAWREKVGAPVPTRRNPAYVPRGNARTGRQVGAPRAQTGVE